MRIVVDTSVMVRYLLRPSAATRQLIEDLWPRYPPFTRDPKDDKFVSCGLSSDAEYLVSYDDELLGLTAVGDMKIGTPKALVRDLRDTEQ